MKKIKPGFFTFWVENYKTSFLLLFLIILIGVASVIVIPKESSPDIKFGIISIATLYTGVNPQDIDSLITEKIENEIEDIDGVSKITSTSSVGLSSVTVEFENGINTRDALTDIKDAVDSLTLPTDAEDPIVQEISTKNELLFDALLYGPSEEYDIFTLTSLAIEMKNELEGKGGIASIDIGGASTNPLGGSSSGESEYEIQVLVSKAKLDNLNLSLGSIVSSIRTFNKNTPLGNYTIGDLEYDFRIEGELSDIKDLENIIVSGDGVSRVRLGDIATFQKEYPNQGIKSLGFYEKTGQNYVALSFNKQSGDNVFSVSKTAKAVLQDYIQTQPEFKELQVKYSQDLAETIIEDYKNLANTAIQTLVLVFVVIFLFVGLRESLITSILLPLSFFITFAVLNIIGISLNFLTNFSLVLTLGIAIDTIIVIIEGASERQKLGYSRKTAVILAVQDLKSPLISGTATTLVAFLPLIFLPGIVGKFLSFIPITVFATLVAALVLSLTLASALFYKLAAKKKIYHSDPAHEESLSDEEKAFLLEERVGKTERKDDKKNRREIVLEKISNGYFYVLGKFIHNKFSRLMAIAIPFVLLVLSFVFLSPSIGFTLFPASDEGIININIEAQTGTDEKSLEKFIPQIENTISSFPELKVYYVTVKGNSMSVYVELTDAIQREDDGLRDVFEVEEEILAGLDSLVSAGLKVEIATQANGPPTGAPVGVKLNAASSNDIGILKEVANDFKEYLVGVAGTKNVSVSSKDNPGQFVYRFDTQKLSFSGLTPDDITGGLRANLSGLSAGTIASQYEDNEIKVQIAEYKDSVSPTDIQNIIISTAQGQVRVGDYLDYSFEPALSSINRLDGKINISVESELENGTLPTDVQPLLEDFAASYNFPSGVSYSSGGENSENAALIQATVFSFFISLFLIFSILVLQFNSYTQPAIILYSVILALLGVNIGLFATGNPYSMTFGIGFIALTGVVVNDAIILIDRINRNLDRLNSNFAPGTLVLEDYVKGLVEAGKSRLQPIIVTTLTTVFGVLPLALQDPFWAGLGFTIIFGLVAGSAMTLFVIPALYYTIYLKKKMREGEIKIEE
ncbi:efflux RND transporter permease subunit [Candidatus Gracilibacteria bacterium]|nr:efflux RND transporter permease subunit [Candidatus Gracilibacteria bacterium]